MEDRLRWAHSLLYIPIFLPYSAKHAQVISDAEIADPDYVPRASEHDSSQATEASPPDLSLSADSVGELDAAVALTTAEDVRITLGFSQDFDFDLETTRASHRRSSGSKLAIRGEPNAQPGALLTSFARSALMEHLVARDEFRGVERAARDKAAGAIKSAAAQWCSRRSWVTSDTGKRLPKSAEQVLHTFCDNVAGWASLLTQLPYPELVLASVGRDDAVRVEKELLLEARVHMIQDHLGTVRTVSIAKWLTEWSAVLMVRTDVDQRFQQAHSRGGWTRALARGPCIPKESRPEFGLICRPIALLNGDYKLLT